MLTVTEPRARELDGVRDEVRQDLPHPPRIGVRDQGVVPRDAQLEGLVARRRGRLPHHLVDERAEVDGAAGELELARLERREVEDVVDERAQVLAALPDDRQRLARVLAERPVDLALQDVREAEDGVERRAQLVAQPREERRALAVHRGGLLEVRPVACAPPRRSG